MTRMIIPMFLTVLIGACSSSRTSERIVVIEFVLAETEPSEGTREINTGALGDRTYLHREVLLGNEDIESASVTDRFGFPAVEVSFNDAGAKKLAEVTAVSKGKRLAILIDGRLVMAPHIMEAIVDGKAMISGITEEEAELIARELGH